MDSAAGRDGRPDGSFWKEFRRAYWNRTPTVIRRPFREPVVTPANVFRGVVEARRRLREPNDDLTFLLGKRRVVMPVDLERLWPREEDGSIEGYHRRIESGGEREKFALNVTDFQLELGWRFFDRLRNFLKGLYEIEGAPPLAQVNLFFGNYRRTGAGVHRDSADIFCFVVEGRKRMRLWAEEQIRSGSPRSGPTPYEEYVEGSICLEGDPGDIIYWPASYWHVAESDGGLGSSLSLSLYYGYALYSAMTEEIGEWSREAMKHRYDPVGALPFSGGPVLPELARVAKRMEGKPGQIERRLVRRWMERTTGYGFEEIPQAEGEGRVRAGRLRANPVSPVLWRKFGADLVISANGRSIVAEYDRELVKWLEALGGGRAVETARMMSGGGRSSGRDAAIRRVLRFLLKERAVEYDSAPERGGSC
jgi:50S ribosomal protein L16 3-hydroxylase